MTKQEKNIAFFLRNNMKILKIDGQFEVEVQVIIRCFASEIRK